MPEQSRSSVTRPRTMAVLLGAGLGFLSAVGIYFDPAEPYPGFVTIAGTLHGVVTALLLNASVTRDSTLGQCIVWGGLYGLLTGAMGFFAEGAWASWNAPYVVPTAVVLGAILGPLIRRFAPRDD